VDGSFTTAKVETVVLPATAALQTYLDSLLHAGVLPETAVLGLQASHDDDDDSVFSYAAATDRTRLLIDEPRDPVVYSMRYFTFKHSRYLLDMEGERFVRISGFGDCVIKIGALTDMSEGLDVEEQQFRYARLPTFRKKLSIITPDGKHTL
jgi:hypothetical protein